MRSRSLSLSAAVLGFLALVSGGARATVILTAAGTPYTENFDTIANTGTSSALPAGWLISESGTNANTTYAADSGSSNAGNTYSYGSVGSTDRALGGLQSGSLNPTIGAGFTNQIGVPITMLTISYTGEEWRLGVAGRPDSLSFQYSLDATGLTDGSWISVAALNFDSPDTVGFAGARDGNSSSDRTAISAAITGLDIASGQSFFLRLVDFNATGADDGLAVDDFQLTPTVVPEPEVWSMMILGFAALAAAKGPRRGARGG